jgi:uncharacterized integral membrane protein
LPIFHQFWAIEAHFVSIALNISERVVHVVLLKEDPALTTHKSDLKGDNSDLELWIIIFIYCRVFLVQDNQKLKISFLFVMRDFPLAFSVALTRALQFFDTFPQQ